MKNNIKPFDKNTTTADYVVKNGNSNYIITTTPPASINAKKAQTRLEAYDAAIAHLKKSSP